MGKVSVPVGELADDGEGAAGGGGVPSVLVVELAVLALVGDLAVEPVAVAVLAAVGEGEGIAGLQAWSLVCIGAGDGQVVGVPFSELEVEFGAVALAAVGGAHQAVGVV